MTAQSMITLSDFASLYGMFKFYNNTDQSAKEDIMMNNNGRTFTIILLVSNHLHVKSLSLSIYGLKFTTYL